MHYDKSNLTCFFVSCVYFHQDFAGHTGAWANHWEEPLPDVGDDLAEKTKAITLDDVKAWIEKHGGIEGRLRWFEAYAPNSRLYQMVAEPLLSMRTTGTLDTERVVKPLKHSILTKKRNKLALDKALVLMRASENLKHLMKIKLEMKKAARPAYDINN